MRTAFTAILLVGLAAACREPASPHPSTSPKASALGASQVVSNSAPVLETFFGPERFTRTTGKPDIFTRTIATARFEAPFVLHVRNGAVDGSNRVSSATIDVDGTRVFGPSDFGKDVGELTASVNAGAVAQLRITLASAPGAFVEIWLEGHRKGLRVCPGSVGPGEFSTLQDAVNAASDGATILLCDGTHHASNVALGDKSLTITAEGPGVPTVDGDGQPVTLDVGRTAATAAAITIRGIRFVNTRHNFIRVGQQYGSIVVEESEFHPYETSPYGSGPAGFEAAVRLTFATGGAAVVRNNTFLGGDVGVEVTATPGVQVRHNHFDGQVRAGTLVLNGATGGRIEENDYTNCGVDFCVDVSNSPNAQIIGNVITIPYSRRTDNPISISSFPSGGDYVITDNEITGVGNGGSGDRSDPLTYPIHVSGIQVAAGSATISRNHVTNSRGGINLTPVLNATGTDNVITHVNAPFLGGGAPSTSTATFTRNDVTDYIKPVEFNGFAAADLRCNWWGTASGPHDTGGLSPTILFSPWATQPIAGHPTVNCP